MDEPNNEQVEDGQADLDSDLEERPLARERELARDLVEQVVTPLVLAGLIDLDEVKLLIRLGTVSALNDIGGTNGLLAKHVSRSPRWFQGVLADLREIDAKGGEMDPEQEQQGPGYRFMMEVLQACMHIYPESISVEGLREALNLSLFEMDDRSFQRRLNVYVGIGLIKRLANSRRGPRFAAKAQMMEATFDTQRGQNIKRRLGWIVPLAVAHIRGQATFSGIAAELSPTALARAEDRLKLATAEIVGDAVAETHTSDVPMNELIYARLLFAMGAVEKPDD